MELDMYGDPAKPCCMKNCDTPAVITENGRHYCPDHYSSEILQIPLEEIGKGGEDD